MGEWVQLQHSWPNHPPTNFDRFYAKRWIWSWAGESYNQAVDASSPLRIRVPTDYGCFQTDLANRQTDSCLTATVGRQDLPNIPDCPYHSDGKVVLSKVFLWSNHARQLIAQIPSLKAILSTQIAPMYCSDPVTSFAEPVFFNRTTCKVVAPTLISPSLFS